MLEKVTIDKLVHGGQGLGVLADGRKVFVWGALPGETVQVRITKKKKSWAEGIAEEIVTPSAERIEPLEPDMYLSTSPWQILDYKAEDHYKQEILKDVFAAERLELEWSGFISPLERYGYRNKMEYNFWYTSGAQKLEDRSEKLEKGSEANDNQESSPNAAKKKDRESPILGVSSTILNSKFQILDSPRLDLALHRRGSHQKLIVKGSVLASDAINRAGELLIDFLNIHKIGGRQLKSAIIRSTLKGDVALVVYVTDETLERLPWADLMTTVHVYYSNPKSPASVATRELAKTGEQYLRDDILGNQFAYAPDGFFQINLPMYEETLRKISNNIDHTKPLVDLYAGVGSIGLCMDSSKIVSVESDLACVMQARLNANEQKGKNIEVVHSESEKVLDYITPEVELIVDPPRAGMHQKVVERIIEQKPAKVVYLSCNPATQARDVRLLVDGGYKTSYAQGFNFFPATPHIESLLVLEA